jgi:hypothetical protein
MDPICSIQELAIKQHSGRARDQITNASGTTAGPLENKGKSTK